MNSILARAKRKLAQVRSLAAVAGLGARLGGPGRTDTREPNRGGSAARRRRASSERGASAIIVAIFIPVLFASIALALDVSKLVTERHQLGNAMDFAALGGAYSLPSDPVTAEKDALALAKHNDPAADPAVSFWCFVASSGAGRTVAAGQIPDLCNPGSVAGAKCDELRCAIPCIPGSGHTCNAITVADDKDVPFTFAPVIGYDTGNTGQVSASACRGGCGELAPNPMDVVLVADRTNSMSVSDRNLMVAGIKSTLRTMTKEQQYVALGTIHRSSSTPGTCITTPSTSYSSGPWIPVPFSNNYLQNPAVPGAAPLLNSSSTLVRGLDCLSASSQGTYLASPMKAAARYVLGLDSNNLASLPVRSHTARQAVIFETDGQPNEKYIAGSTSLTTAGDIGSTDGTTACNNLKAVAADAKNRGVLIVTVAFGNATTERCGGGAYVRNVLAATASKDSQGNPSDSDNDCSSPALRAVENGDGDFFFCAAEGSELGPIFLSAINAISPSSHLIRIPD